MELKSIQELLEAGGLRHPSDLDLLLFFYRHPHVLLTLDHLAAYTGYDLQQVAPSLDFLVGAGLLRRELNVVELGDSFRQALTVVKMRATRPIEPRTSAKS